LSDFGGSGVRSLRAHSALDAVSWVQGISICKGLLWSIAWPAGWAVYLKGAL
jgi:hypothetical protein